MQCMKEDTDKHVLQVEFNFSVKSFLGANYNAKGLDDKLRAVSGFEDEKSSWMVSYELNEELMSSLNGMVWDDEQKKLETE